MNWWLLVGIVIVLAIFIYAVLPVLWTRVAQLSVLRKTGKPGTVALTFDDGPHPDYTPRLLDVLSEYRIHATFFVLSSEALANQEIIWRMIREGHDVQVHGSRHWFVPLLHPWATVQQCIGASQDLSETFHTLSVGYRPTWGACNLVTLFVMRLTRMRLCTWSVMVGDWRVTPASELIRRMEAKLDDGSIIVLHDSDKTPGAEKGAPNTVIEAIPRLVQLVESRHLKFITMAECVEE